VVTSATTMAGYREIAHRTNTFLEVFLLWRQADGSVLLRLIEVANRVEFELVIPPEDALDAFNHPYAYLPGRLGEPTALLTA
jgi:hypothetical protein